MLLLCLLLLCMLLLCLLLLHMLLLPCRAAYLLCGPLCLLCLGPTTSKSQATRRPHNSAG